jgi:NhaP-type Na+/H+ or K+/H+ antiporter
MKIEAGMNDIVVLPVILVLIAVIQAEDRGAGGWVAFLGQLILLGPAIGFITGGIGSWLINKADSWVGVRREHQALYGIGLVLAAYTAATVAGGDGFLSAFAAGLAVTLLNQSLCDCFLGYGEVTLEMAMLLAFILFGAVLSGILDTINVPLAFILAGLVIFTIRPSVLGLVLARASTELGSQGVFYLVRPSGT